jgi:hypothetical protein
MTARGLTVTFEPRGRQGTKAGRGERHEADNQGRERSPTAMRRGALSVMTIATFLACLAGSVAVAQDKPTDTMDILREKLRADKKLVVAAALDLTEAEGKAFWPVYNAYQSDMIQHYDRVSRLIGVFAKTYGSMTDEAAAKLLDEYLTLQTNQVALLRSYAPRFRRVLPAKKVAQLYQIENKMRALVDYEFAREIPLIK